MCELNSSLQRYLLQISRVPKQQGGRQGFSNLWINKPWFVIFKTLSGLNSAFSPAAADLQTSTGGESLMPLHIFGWCLCASAVPLLGLSWPPLQPGWAQVRGLTFFICDYQKYELGSSWWKRDLLSVFFFPSETGLSEQVARVRILEGYG